MTDDEQAVNPFWDPFGLWRGISRLGEQQREAAMSTRGFPAATAPLQWLFEASRSRLVGRRVSWSVGGAQLEFDLQDITMTTDSMLLGAGQADELSVVATDVVWGTHSFPAARATFHNVHTRPGQRPALVAAPVDLRLRVTADDVAGRIEARVPWLRVEITESGELRARHRKRSAWGRIGFTVAPQGRGIAANLQSLEIAGRSWRLPSRLRAIHVPLSLPEDARLKEVVTLPEAVELHIRLDERRVDLRSATSFLSRH